MSSSVPPPQSQRMPYPPGTVLAGKYRIERLLGEGGMGWVVVATHMQLEQRVAMKFMHATQANENTEAITRFLREARAAARIQSEHVARVSDFGTLDSGAPYLVMEYLEGQDLDSLLHARGALPVELVVDYAMQACEGLAEAHAAGIVHRDLKPANLFLARRIDGSVRVKLLDFGISKLSAPGGMPEAAMTNTQALMGSPLYMAPEQLRSSKNVDHRADIWSMGVILYEMLAGRPPFDGETLPVVCARIMTESPPPLHTVMARIPNALESVVMRCLDRDPPRRFQDVAALARALAPFGTAEARVAADRIGRFVRARALSSPEIAAESEASAADSGDGEDSVASRRGVGQTRATFSKTGHGLRTQRGSRALPLAIGGGALFIAAAVSIGVAASRGHSKEFGPGASSTASHVAGVNSAGSTEAEKPTPAATVPATSTATATPPAAVATAPAATAAPAAKTKPSTPSTAAQSHTQTQAKPAASAPKAAPTAGFGGRD